MPDKLIAFQVRQSQPDGQWCVDYSEDGKTPVQIAACFDDEESAWVHAERNGLTRPLTGQFTDADAE